MCVSLVSVLVCVTIFVGTPLCFVQALGLWATYEYVPLCVLIVCFLYVCVCVYVRDCMYMYIVSVCCVWLEPRN